MKREQDNKIGGTRRKKLKYKRADEIVLPSTYILAGRD